MLIIFLSLLFPKHFVTAVPLVWFHRKNCGFVSLSFMAPTFLTGFVSVGLKNLTKYAPHFPRPCGLKQILTWVLGLDSSSKGPKQIFTSVPLSLWTQTNFDLGLLSLGLISLNFLGSIHSASRHQCLHRICFPPP